MAIQVAIEGYDSLEQIGIGGMAAVYRARKVSIDKTVAIKVLFPYLATDESYIERFQREAKAAASIQHENIVNVIDFGESDGSFFIVMEYYEGRTLEQWLKERPGIPPDIAVQILLEVALGLEAAHALDIVHRDIKPANIIFTNQGGVKIADFGLARKSDSMTMITQLGKVIGTPAYMSPEQAAGRPVGPASDLFSLGVVAYEVLGRRKPFDGKAYSEVLEKIQTHNPPAISAVNPLIPAEFEEIVQRALDKDERTRYASATRMIADMEAAMEKNKIARDRRRLVSYVKDPDSYDASFAENTITQCLSRGAFFMQKGHTHLEDAVLEYRRILYLDPNNERARANLNELRDEPRDAGRTQTIDAVKAAAKKGAPASRLQTTATRTRPAPRRRRVPRWTYSAGAAGILACAAVVIWSTPVMRASNDNLKGSGAVVSEDSAVQRAQTQDTSARRDSLLALSNAGKQAIRPAPQGTTMSSGLSTSPVENANAPTEVAKKEPKRPDPEIARKTDTKNDREIKGPSLGSNLEKPAVKTFSEPAPAPGSLSVFFLGGVGELWVDGKLFSQQPPFDGAAIAAGTHRVACRMSGEESRREFTVAIKPGRTTVIEYEVGGEPVISEE